MSNCPWSPLALSPTQTKRCLVGYVRRDTRRASVGQPAPKAPKANLTDCEIILTSDDRAEKDFADELGRSLADTGLKVGLTFLRPENVIGDILSDMARNSVSYACVVDPMRGLRGTVTIKFLAKDAGAQDMRQLFLSEAVGILQRDFARPADSVRPSSGGHRGSIAGSRDQHRPPNRRENPREPVRRAPDSTPQVLANESYNRREIPREPTHRPPVSTPQVLANEIYNLLGDTRGSTGGRSGSTGGTGAAVSGGRGDHRAPARSPTQERQPLPQRSPVRDARDARNPRDSRDNRDNRNNQDNRDRLVSRDSRGGSGQQYDSYAPRGADVYSSSLVGTGEHSAPGRQSQYQSSQPYPTNSRDTPAAGPRDARLPHQAGGGVGVMRDAHVDPLITLARDAVPVTCDDGGGGAGRHLGYSSNQPAFHADTRHDSRAHQASTARVLDRAGGAPPARGGNYNDQQRGPPPVVARPGGSGGNGPVSTPAGYPPGFNQPHQAHGSQMPQHTAGEARPQRPPAVQQGYDPYAPSTHQPLQAQAQQAPPLQPPTQPQPKQTLYGQDSRNPPVQAHPVQHMQRQTSQPPPSYDPRSLGGRSLTAVQGLDPASQHQPYNSNAVPGGGYSRNSAHSGHLPPDNAPATHRQGHGTAAHGAPHNASLPPPTTSVVRGAPGAGQHQSLPPQQAYTPRSRGGSRDTSIHNSSQFPPAAHAPGFIHAPIHAPNHAPIHAPNHAPIHAPNHAQHRDHQRPSYDQRQIAPHNVGGGGGGGFNSSSGGYPPRGSGMERDPYGRNPVDALDDRELYKALDDLASMPGVKETLISMASHPGMH